MNIKIFALACIFVAPLALQTAAKDFTTKTTFNSVESFVAAMKDFSPSRSKGDIAALFEDAERGEGELGARIQTAKFDKVETLTDEGANVAVVFVSAEPPTDRIPVAMGVLFLLTQDEGRWHIADLLRFVTAGSEASVHAEGTYFDHPGDGKQSTAVLTVTVWSGGRRRNRGVSESYEIEKSRFVRAGLAPTRADGKLLEPPVSPK